MFKKKSIGFQTFINISIIFLIVFFIQLLLQLLFFKSFYSYYKVNSFKDDFKTLLISSASNDDMINKLALFSKETNTHNYIMNYKVDSSKFEDSLLSLEVKTDVGIIQVFTHPNDMPINTAQEISFYAFKHRTENKYFAISLKVMENYLIGSDLDTHQYNNQLLNNYFNGNTFNHYDIHYIHSFTGTVEAIKQPNIELTNDMNIVINELIQLPYIFQDSRNLKVFKVDDQAIGTYYSSQFDDSNSVVFISNLSMDGNHYDMMTIMPLNQAHEILQITLFFTVIATFILFIITAILAYIYSLKLTLPISSLVDLTTEKTFFENKNEITVDTENELRVLAENFNHLHRTIEQNTQQLDNQNKKLLELIKLENQNKLIREQLVLDLSRELIEPLDTLNKQLNKNSILAAKDQLNSINGIITNFTKVTAIKDKRDSTQHHSFNLKFLINKVILELELLIKRKNIIIQPKLESLTVIGDRSKIHEVLKNLLTTALHYTEVHNIIVLSLTSDKKKAKFDIRIPGVILTESKIETMFDPITNVHNNNDINLLSMYIVRLILEQHNSEFHVFNSREGIIFYFNLDTPLSYNSNE